MQSSLPDCNKFCNDTAKSLPAVELLAQAVERAAKRVCLSVCLSLMLAALPCLLGSMTEATMDSKWVQKPVAENEISKGTSFGQAAFNERLGLWINVQDGEILRAKDLAWQRARGRDVPRGGAGEQALEWDLWGGKGWEWLHHTLRANRPSSLTRYWVTIAMRSLCLLWSRWNVETVLSKEWNVNQTTLFLFKTMNTPDCHFTRQGARLEFTVSLKYWKHRNSTTAAGKTRTLSRVTSLSFQRMNPPMLPRPNYLQTGDAVLASLFLAVASPTAPVRSLTVCEWGRAAWGPACAWRASRSNRTWGSSPRCGWPCATPGVPSVWRICHRGCSGNSSDLRVHRDTHRLALGVPRNAGSKQAWPLLKH